MRNDSIIKKGEVIGVQSLLSSLISFSTVAVISGLGSNNWRDAIFTSPNSDALADI